MKLLILRRSLGVLLIRGGLGNQLFQLSALYSFSEKYQFVPMFFDQEIKKESPNGRTQDLLKLSLNSMSILGCVKASNSFIRLILRLILKINRSWRFLPIVDESALNTLTRQTLPRLFFIQDYFQNKKYPLSIPEPLIRSTFENQFALLPAVPTLTLKRPNCLIHIRLTDSHTRSDKVLKRGDLLKLLHSLLTKSQSTTFNFISDDPKGAEQFLAFHEQDFKLYNLEKTQKLSTLELLRLFTVHDYVVCSMSTLCWWGCFLSTKLKVGNAQIFSSFPEQLHLIEWIKFKPLR